MTWDGVRGAITLHSSCCHVETCFPFFILISMQFYRSSIGADLTPEKLSELDEGIHLVRHTRELINLFHSKQVISSVAGTRIIKAIEFIADLQG